MYLDLCILNCAKAIKGREFHFNEVMKGNIAKPAALTLIAFAIQTTFTPPN